MINNEINFDELSKTYINNKPFKHIIIDNFLDIDLAKKLSFEFPDHNKDFWLKYNNPIEKKLLYNKIDENIPFSIKNLLLELNKKSFLKLISKLTKIDNLISDPDFHGGGMHCIKNGGKLDVHIDYSIHPSLNLERRINLILYLNQNWANEYGGCLELWDKKMTKCEKKIAPLFNRAVIFNTGDSSYHGHPEPLKCPSDVSRKSLAWYFLTTPQEKATKRYKARFVARPNDPKNKEIEDFRVKRSTIDSASDLYQTDDEED